MKNSLKFLFIFLLSVSLTGCVFFHPSPQKLYRQALAKKPFDVIIVPGCPFDSVKWSYAMEGRVAWAVYLYNKGITKNIIFSGAATYTPYVEARIMALYAEKLGVPAEHIFIEDQAKHSTENVYYGYHIAKKNGFGKMAIATDPFQSVLLMRFSKRRFKLPIQHIPIVADSLRNFHYETPQIDPRSAWQSDFHSILETQTKWQRFRGTSGKNIHFEKE